MAEGVQRSRTKPNHLAAGRAASPLIWSTALRKSAGGCFERGCIERRITDRAGSRPELERDSRHDGVNARMLWALWRRSRLLFHADQLGRAKQGAHGLAAFQQKKAPARAGAFSPELDFLQRPDVLGLEALGALRHLKLHALPFLQAAETARLDRGEVHENILTALAADESVTLGIVKPLYCSLFHILCSNTFR